MDVVKMMKLLGPLEEELVRLMRKIGTKPSAAAGTPSPLPLDCCACCPIPRRPDCCACCC